MQPVDARHVTVVTSSLFQGDTQRLEPHLGFLGMGCLKFDFKRPELLIKLDWMRFHDGKIAHQPFEILLTEPGELTFSLKEIYQQNERITYHAVISAAGKHSYTNIEMPMPKGSQFVGLGSATNYSLSDGMPVQLWTLAGGELLSDMEEDDVIELPFEELANHYEWGLGLRLSVL